MWFFSLKAQIQLTSILEKSSSEQIIEDLNKVNYGFTIYNYHNIDKDTLILNYKNIQNQKIGYINLEHKFHKFNSKSLFTNFSNYDSILIFYERQLNTIFCYRKIDSIKYSFNYGIILKDEFLSHLHFDKGIIYTLLYNKKNDILKVKKFNNYSKETVLIIEDPIFKIFSTIEGRKNYSFFRNSIIYCDYSNKSLKIFDLNKNLDTLKLNFESDTTLNKVISYTKKYRMFGNGHDYISATDLLESKNLLISIYTIDTFILVNISNSGYSKRAEKFTFLNKIDKNFSITEINSFNPYYPIVSDTINSTITFKNAPLYFHNSYILIDNNKFICPVLNINNNDLQGNNKLNDLYKLEEETSLNIKKYYFFIYEIN